MLFEITNTNTPISMSSSNSHTILLVQPSHKPTSRTYCDFETLTEALEGGSYELVIVKQITVRVV